MIEKTKWFIKNSKQYMAGESPSIYQWIRAYIRFMWISRKDWVEGMGILQSYNITEKKIREMSKEQKG